MGTNAKTRKKKPTPIGKHRARYIDQFVDMVTNLESSRKTVSVIAGMLGKMNFTQELAELMTAEERASFISDFKVVQSAIQNFDSKYPELRQKAAAVVIPSKRDEEAELEFNGMTYLITSEVSNLMGQSVLGAVMRGEALYEQYLKLLELKNKGA